MVTLQSFGFKYGRPQANIVFDVSYFKNPWRDEKIRHEKDLVIRKKLIMDYMLSQRGVDVFLNTTTSLLMTYNELFPEENIQVAFCCSAGEYRSPSLVELIANEMSKRGIECAVSHSHNSKI